VINLSDLRESKQQLFTQKIQKFNTINKNRIHSIFSPFRNNEREVAFCIKDNSPVIIAWGTEKFLLDLASNAKNTLTIEKIKYVTGIPVDDTNELLYFHASPYLKEHKMRWLTNILEKI
jgi:hypothetical protein